MKKGLEIAGAGLVAAVVIACGEAAMNGGAGMMGGAGGMLADAGDVMMDAGESMIDASAEMMRDAGTVMMDAGGGMMRDAGEVVRDAGEIMRDASMAMRDASDGMTDSAMAQSCEACTPSGRQMVVTADQDIEQLRRGSVERAGWVEHQGPAGSGCPAPQSMRTHAAEIIDGPFVLTDARLSAGVQLFTVAAGAQCTEVYVDSTLIPCSGGGALWSGERFRRPLGSQVISFDSGAVSIHGARILVPDGQTLCAFTGSNVVQPTDSGASTTPALVSWSGFVPYE